MKKYILILSIIAFSCFLLSTIISAHTEENNKQAISYSKWINPIIYIEITGLIIIITTALMLISNTLKEKHKKLLFLVIAIPSILSTIYLSGFTIYETFTSETRGPVHWHADYQVIACSEQLDLIDPKFPSNKIGSPLFHEHNDDRIHIEGTVKNLEEITLNRYFEIISGELENNHLVYQTENNIINYENGDTCPDGTKGALKVYINGKKEENYEDYVIYPDSRVPSGDCIIILFDNSDSETTNILCDSWKVNDWNYDNFKRRKITMGDKTWA